MMEPKILYKDKFLVIAVKPAGILSQPDKTGDMAMTDMLSKLLDTTVLPVHRLDRAVGGVAEQYTAAVMLAAEPNGNIHHGAAVSVNENLQYPSPLHQYSTVCGK